MVVGRLNKESNPVKRERAGFTPQHKLPDGSFIDTGETNPLPTKNDLVLAKLAEMDTKIGATNTRLNGVLDTNLVGAVSDNMLAELKRITSSLQEQLTETDAITGTLTFSDFIKEIGIYNRDVSEGVFTVNNLAITIPADTFFQAEIGGTPSKTIDVTGSSSYIIGRYA